MKTALFFLLIGKGTPEQIQFIDKINSLGGKAAIVSSLDQVIEMFK